MMSCIVYYKYYARSVRDAIVFLSFWHFNSCERAKRIRICYVWTRIFLQTEGKNLRFQKYPDTCGLGLRLENTIYNVQSPRRNRPLPSSKNPHFQNEVRCATFLVKMIFICMRMKNSFHIKGSALNLVLIQRPGGTGKWSIVLLNNKTFNFRDIKKHPSIQFSPLNDALLSLIKYKINIYGSFSFYRLYRENQRKLEEERRERLRQEELARQRATQPKPWRPKQVRKRKTNYCGRLQKW